MAARWSTIGGSFRAIFQGRILGQTRSEMSRFPKMLVPRSLDGLFHGSAFKADDNWGYPYDLGSPHIYPYLTKP